LVFYGGIIVTHSCVVYTKEIFADAKLISCNKRSKWDLKKYLGLFMY